MQQLMRKNDLDDVNIVIELRCLWYGDIATGDIKATTFTSLKTILKKKVDTLVLVLVVIGLPKMNKKKISFGDSVVVQDLGCKK